MNRVTKLLLLILFTVISFSSANMIKNNLIDSKINKNYEPSELSKIQLPTNVKYDNNLISQVKDVSEATDTSFTFRVTYVASKNDGKGNVDFIKPINRVMFFHTKHLPKEDKVFVTHGFEYVFLNFPLSKITSVQLKNSDIYITNKNKSKGLKKLADLINKKYGLNIQDKDLLSSNTNQYDTHYGDFIGYNNSNLTLFIVISNIFFAILLFVWLVSNNKKIAIYRLNGLSSTRITKLLFMKEFCCTALLIYLIVSLANFKSLNFEYTIMIMIMMSIVVIISYLAVLLVSKFSLSNQINSKSFFKYSHYTLYSIKAFVFLVTISTSASLIYLINSGLNTNTKTGNDYSVLYPEYVGYTLNSDSSYNNDSDLTSDLFNYAEKHDGLYVNPIRLNVENSDEKNVLQLNYNYLLKFNIKTSDNKSILINNDNTSGIVVVSDKLKPYLKDIKKFYASSSSFSSPTIHYYFMKDNQKFKLLDGSNGNITPDLLEIYTSKNVGQNLDALHNATMKFKILGTKDKTYNSIKKILKKHGQLETHPSLITVNNINRSDYLSSIGNPLSYTVTNGLIILIFLSMILSTTFFYFEFYKKKIAVSYLYGMSYLRTYKSLFVLLSIQGLIFLIYGALQQNRIIILEALLLYFMIEIIITIWLSKKLQKKLMLNFLKGE